MSHCDYTPVLNIIKQIALNNEYKDTLIDKMIEQNLLNQAHKFAFPQISNKSQNFHTLTFTGKTFEIIYKYFKHLNINIACKTTNSLGKHDKCKADNDVQYVIFPLWIL